MKRLFFIFLMIPSLLEAQQIKPLRFQEETHDFGYVDQNGDPVSYSFQFTNTSGRPVRILSVKASCGCTTPNWSKEPIAPGQSGFVEAQFDPTGRPGFFSKSLTVTTDFDSNPVVLQIKGQVSLASGHVPNEDLRIAKGNWKLKSSSFNLGKVLMKDEYTSKDFPVLNNGDKAVTFEKAEGPDYIRAEVIPATLEPGAQGKIRISYNGKEKGAYGFQSDHIRLYTDDALQLVKPFSVYATLEEFFPAQSREDLMNAPRLTVEVGTFDFGKIKQHTEVHREITISNTGKSPLAIRSVQPNCACIDASMSSNEIKPGQQATLLITFDPEDRLGTQQKSVLVYANDPQSPVQRIIFNAYVED